MRLYYNPKSGVYINNKHFNSYNERRKSITDEDNFYKLIQRVKNRKILEDRTYECRVSLAMCLKILEAFGIKWDKIADASTYVEKKTIYLHYLSIKKFGAF